MCRKIGSVRSGIIKVSLPEKRRISVLHTMFRRASVQRAQRHGFSNARNMAMILFQWDIDDDSNNRLDLIKIPSVRSPYWYYNHNIQQVLCMCQPTSDTSKPLFITSNWLITSTVLSEIPVKHAAIINMNGRTTKSVYGT